MCDIPIDLSRRRLVRLASLATGALTLGGVPTLLANEQDAVRRETADLITGPFLRSLSRRVSVDDGHPEDGSARTLIDASLLLSVGSSLVPSQRRGFSRGSRSRWPPTAATMLGSSSARIQKTSRS
jgi:hypothetical protein